MDIVADILQLLERGRAEIVANMAREGVNASGRTARAFAVRNKDGHLQIYRGEGEKKTIDTPHGSFAVGVAPIDTLEVGVPPHTPPRGFYYIIKNWTREKGLQFSTERERGTFAYFVARKIAREGTRRHAQHIDIYTSVAEKLAADIRAKFADNVKLTIQAASNK